MCTAGGSRVTAWCSSPWSQPRPGCASPGMPPTRPSSPGATKWRSVMDHGSSSRNTAWCPNSQPGKKPARHMSSRGYLDVIDGGARIAAAILTAPVLRGPHNRWGATPAEVSATMPGDELVPKPKITSTRAITIDAPPRDVWPWLVQIGQGRGGFYSYDALENLVRCDIHSADRIIPQLQQLDPGDLILLAAAGGPCFRVSKAQPPSVLALVGADPKTRVAAPIPATPEELASTWQWV